MKRLRKYVSLRERLAAALSLLLPQETRDALRNGKAPAKAVIGMFDQDHNILHAFGGADRWWNLTPILRAQHREKARRDTAIVAKVRRIEAEPNKWRDILKPKLRTRRKHKGPKRQLQSRPFATN